MSRSSYIRAWKTKRYTARVSPSKIFAAILGKCAHPFSLFYFGIFLFLRGFGVYSYSNFYEFLIFQEKFEQKNSLELSEISLRLFFKTFFLNSSAIQRDNLKENTENFKGYCFSFSFECINMFKYFSFPFHGITLVIRCFCSMGDGLGSGGEGSCFRNSV